MSICDIVTFRTSQGDITLKDYLRRNPGVVYYYKNLDGLSQTEALFEAQGLPVIDARFFPEEAFLMKYAKCHPGIKLEHLKPGAQFIFTDVQDPANQWGKLTDVLAGYGVVCRLTRFSPPEIPAVLIVTEDIKVARKLKKTSFERERSESTLVFIKDFLDRVSPDERFDKGILHINTASPILRALLDMPADSPHFRNVIEIIYHNARLFSGKSLTAREILDDFIGINRNLENILAAVGFSAQARDFLDPGVFIEMGLSSAKAKEIAGYCETIKEFRACDPETLAGKVKLPAKIIKALQSAVESG